MRSKLSSRKAFTLIFKTNLRTKSHLFVAVSNTDPKSTYFLAVGNRDFTELVSYIYFVYVATVLVCQ